VQPLGDPDAAGVDADHQRAFDAALGELVPHAIGHRDDRRVDGRGILEDVGAAHSGLLILCSLSQISSISLAA
jgi:hypothetical protein